MGWGNSFELPSDTFISHDDPTIKNINTKNLVQAYSKVINRTNAKPTHDPYTNPDCYLYYECGCGAILDPHTKRFAELNNHASEKGWKIRFGDDAYIPYCVKCGHDVD